MPSQPFGLSAADSGHFADILAAASSNANTNVSMMGETFKYCAPIAGALGFSAEDTAEAIGLMANSGIKASQAGTSLRTIMNNLSGEVTFVGKNIGEVTIATSNADGSMRSLNDILADCRVAFSGLSESEKAANAEALVGKNAMSGFLALMNSSETDINKLCGAIENCDGASESMAETMQDNLNGQLTILKSQLEELAISFGDILMPTIRKIVSAVQQFVDKLNSMDESTRETIIKIGLLAASIGPLLIVLGKTISTVGTAMRGLQFSCKGCPASHHPCGQCQRCVQQAGCGSGWPVRTGRSSGGGHRYAGGGVYEPLEYKVKSSARLLPASGTILCPR